MQPFLLVLLNTEPCQKLYTLPPWKPTTMWLQEAGNQVKYWPWRNVLQAETTSIWLKFNVWIARQPTHNLGVMPTLYHISYWNTAHPLICDFSHTLNNTSESMSQSLPSNLIFPLETTKACAHIDHAPLWVFYIQVSVNANFLKFLKHLSLMSPNWWTTHSRYSKTVLNE